MPVRNLQYWRDRAEEARARAEKFSDREAKTTMEDIAHGYEAMAKRAEAREKREKGSG